MSKETCVNGHKWLTEVAGYENCPVCTQPPMPKPNYEYENAKAWHPPKDHGCKVISTPEGTTVIVCRR